MSGSIYKRVLLKLGGESLVNEEGDFGLHENALKNITEEIKAAKDLGVEIAIVIGGGNILRGASLSAIGIVPAVVFAYLSILIKTLSLGIPQRSPVASIIRLFAW